MPTKKLKTSPFTDPPLDYLEDLDKQASDKKQGEMTRINALEWLRCESLKRAYSHIHDFDLQEMKKANCLEGSHKEIVQIRSGYHHWLIGQGEGPPDVWIYRYPLPSLNRAFACAVLKPGQTEYDLERLLLSIDPSRPEAEIMQQVKQVMRTWKQGQKKHGKRAHGGGRRHPLATLWKALKAHDNRQMGLTQSVIGRHADIFPPVIDPKKLQVRGQKLIVLAKNMMDTAQHHPLTWLQRYL